MGSKPENMKLKSSAHDRAPSTKGQSVALELKASVFTLTVVRLRSWDLADIQRDLAERVAQGPRFFENAPVVIDVDLVRDANCDASMFSGLIDVLRNQRLIPVGLRNGKPEQNQFAAAAGLAVLKGGPVQELGVSNAGGSNATTSPKTANASNSKTKSNLSTDTDTSTTPPSARSEFAAATHTSTKIITQPVRSGQRIYAQGGDLVLLASVNAGAEIMADGNIHVYAPLRGRALAGVKGDTTARIFCHVMEAELIAIAGQYRLFEDSIPPEIKYKSMQAYLDGEQLIISPLS